MGDKIKIRFWKKDDKSQKDRALEKAVYLVKYGKKFNEFGFTKNFMHTVLDDSALDIVELIRKSKTEAKFSKNVNEFLKSQRYHAYSQALLLGNLTGQYSLHYRRSNRIQGLNIDAFSKENSDLLQDLRKHFAEYILSDNKRKNTFAEKTELRLPDCKTYYRDLTKDIKEEYLLEYFDSALANEIEPSMDDIDTAKFRYFAEYIISTIGTYSREDIKNNFDFILYDLDNSTNKSLNERRERYMSLRGLSAAQIKKIDQVDELKRRLNNMQSYPAIALKTRLDDIDYNLKDNISELEDIYLDYELLCRQDLIDNLFVPENNVTIVTNYQEAKPQLIHKFLRNVDKFREKEHSKIKKRIISERKTKNPSPFLTEEEKVRFEDLKQQVEANLDQYKVNYSINNIDGIYSDANGFQYYQADTSNQISAQLFTTEKLIDDEAGIIGIGFNRENLTPEAIAISSNYYKTTNKSLNNLEYNEKKEFTDLSAPFQELTTARNSEIVLQRRGLDFDTKASYIFAIIDSSNEEQTKNIMEKIKSIQEKEGLKAVIYDKYLIKQSLQEQEPTL